MRHKGWIAVLAVAASGAFASAAVADIADSASGHGHTDLGTGFSFTAREAIGTTPANGYGEFFNPAFAGDTLKRAGNVVCASIVGNQAVFGIKDLLESQSGNGTHVYRYRIYYAEDNGNPNGAGVDRVKELKAQTTAPRSKCGVRMPALGSGHLLTDGNILVRDRPDDGDFVTVI